MTPTATFEPVEVPLTLAGRKAVLRFAPSPSKPDKRYVELSVSSESEFSTSSQWLESGSNADLIEYLRRPDVVADTPATADELVQSYQSGWPAESVNPDCSVVAGSD